MPTSVSGRWEPLPHILFGVAIFPFVPVAVDPKSLDLKGKGKAVGDEEADRRDADAAPLVSANPHQVPLEVGDDCYAFEQYVPYVSPPSRQGADSSVIWYRGYVFSGTQQTPLQALSAIGASESFEGSSSAPSALVPEDPQVFIGIFPASHVQVREQLDDVEQRLSQVSSLDPPNSGALAKAASRSWNRPGGRMESLPEEDETELVTPRTSRHLPAPANAYGLGMRRSRTSVASIAPDLLFQLSTRQRNGRENANERPPPPLPSLKPGDETVAGNDEPLIDEISCALREWYSSLYLHLQRRNYALFRTMTAHIEALYMGRRQLLAQTLSTDEVAKLRRDLVKRLAAGNVAQGLDVIVRHPDYGALVDTEVDPETVDSRAWMSSIRMYVNQVNLAYIGNAKDREALLGNEGATNALLSALANNSKLSEPNTVPLNAHLPSLRSTRTAASIDSSDPNSSTRPKFFHVWLDVRAFGTSPCLPGETAELYFSLYNKSDARFLTEEFCVILNHQGVPFREEARNGRIRTVFKDLSQHDVQDQIYLVCRIVKNGAFKTGSNLTTNGLGDAMLPGFNAAREKEDTATMNSTMSTEGLTPHFASPDANGEYAGMTITLPSGGQSFRRPFGCAAVEISGLHQAETAESLCTAPKNYTMAVFTPANEAAFPTLHEDIIASRLKELMRSTKMESISIHMRIFYGDANSIAREHSNLLSDVPITSRLGFPDVVFPDDSRNEIFVKLWSGEFPSAGLSSKIGGAGKNVEVAAEVRTKSGRVLERVISRGSGESRVTRYNSTVFRGNGVPTWGEMMKLEVPPEFVEDCHIFFTFRNRTEKTRTVPGTIEKPFAFTFLPLFSDNNAFIHDGGHDLCLFRFERPSVTADAYLRTSPFIKNGQSPMLSQSAARVMIPLKDTFAVRTFLCSTRHTQDDTLLRLMRWDKGLLESREQVTQVLTKLRFASEVEICKFLRNIFDALFGVLGSQHNSDGQYDDLVFNALVTLLGIVSDRRFTNFKPVADLYIDQHFSCRSASGRLVGSLQRLLATPTSPETAQTLRSSIKVWGYLLRFIVQSRALQRIRDLAMNESQGTTDAIEARFKADLSGLMARITAMMSITAPSSIIGTQTLAVQRFASLLPDLSKCYTAEELLGIANEFCDAISATKGKIVIWKLLLQEQIVMSSLVDSTQCRQQLIPKLTTWIKPHLGKFEEFTMVKPKDNESAKDLARISWLEGIRVSTAIVAAALDKLHEALIDPGIVGYRNSLLQEEDNVEYLLGLLPKLLESYSELDNPANMAAIQRASTTAAVITPVPVVFPSAYPFSLVNVLPNAGGSTENALPTMQNSLGEVACVIVSLLLLAPRRLLSGFLDGMLEVEGKDNFGRFLDHLFRVCTSILENRAFPAQWLNISISAHRVVLKLVEVTSGQLQREFIPTQSAFAFNTRLWASFFTMLHRLLASKHLIIEEFPPQRRRAVWRLAGDIRGEGSGFLLKLWEAIGLPEAKAGLPGTMTRFGGFQVQFVPSMVEPLLELCLSHHDEMRSNAVSVLYSMIVSEYALNQNFTVVADEIIDKLDQLIGNSSSRGDDLSRAFFVTQLRGLFDSSDVQRELKKQVATFLDSVNQFLELLLGIRSLPPGDEFIDDRVIGTLKLMSFVRNIGRSAIYIRYVHKLVNFHAACHNYTEAGLALKLHADLHNWDISTTVEAMPDLDLPDQSEFNRKETLYLRILDLLGKGKAWESGIEICKELQAQYEHISFNYERLSEVLSHQSGLYNKIAFADRYFSEYFRVAFYGLGFPTTVQNRQFVYRGVAWEKYGAFCDRIHNKHPNAQILKTPTVPVDQLQFAEGQYIHVTSVNAEPDRTSIIFTNPAVPNAVRVYYEHNATNTFTSSRPFTRTSDAPDDLASIWTEKTFLVCEDAFPTVLQRSEVVEIRLLEISPLENAVLTVDEKTRDLDALKRRYLALSQNRVAQLNTNPLSMALNEAVDAPAKTGIPMFRTTFLSSEYVRGHPDDADRIAQLRAAIVAQATVLDDCLRLHQSLCPAEMRVFHSTLQKFFEKHFAEELTHLPPRPSMSSLTESVPNSAVTDEVSPLPSFTNGHAKRGLSVDTVGRNDSSMRGRSDSAATTTSVGVGYSSPISGSMFSGLGSSPVANMTPSWRMTQPRGLTGGIDTAPTHQGFLSDQGGTPLLGRKASVSASTAALGDGLVSPGMSSVISTGSYGHSASPTSNTTGTITTGLWPTAPNGASLTEQGYYGRLTSPSADTLKSAKSGERRSLLGVKFGSRRGK